ncbi:MAG: cupin domain-containing protein [Candidatus Acidiferrales bacterium]
METRKEQIQNMLTAEQIREVLKMQPHPIEGGYFAETYRGLERVPRSALQNYPADRSISTAIYYMLTADTFSAMHRVRGDEMFHFYLGDPVEMLQLRPDGSGEVILLGQDIAAGMLLQHNVPGGVWQGSRVCDGGKYALLGTTMAPGFEYEDYETGGRRELVVRYPQHAERITALTR